MQQSLYYSVIFFIPSITVSGQTLIDVYGRIVSQYYNFKVQNGVIQLEIGETLLPQITYSYDVELVVSPNSSISAQDLINTVLAAIPNSSILP
jgi:hypothetical protein